MKRLKNITTRSIAWAPMDPTHFVPLAKRKKILARMKDRTVILEVIYAFGAFNKPHTHQFRHAEHPRLQVKPEEILAWTDIPTIDILPEET